MNTEKIIELISNGRNLKNEELWNLGYGVTLKNKIEVNPKNIAPYEEYKHAKIEEIFGQDKNANFCWERLPKDQIKQVKEIMNLIRRSIISLKFKLTVRGISQTTLKFLCDLGYDVWGDYEAAWINWKDVRKKCASEDYITANLAHGLTIFLNEFLLLNFLYHEKEQGKQYVIIRSTEAMLDDYESTDYIEKFLQTLNLEYNSESLIEAYSCEKLIFIKLNLTNLELQERKKYLEQYLRLN